MTGRAERSPDRTPEIWWSPQHTAVEELRRQAGHEHRHTSSGRRRVKDIEQQTGDTCEAAAAFPEVSVSLRRFDSLQQPYQHWEQHFHEAQHTFRRTFCSQRLLNADKDA